MPNKIYGCLNITLIQLHKHVNLKHTCTPAGWRIHPTPSLKMLSMNKS